MIERRRDWAATLSAIDLSLAPVCRATRLRVPADREEKTMVRTKFRAPASPTEAIASVPSLPTIIMSTMKTIMWRTFSAAAGMARRAMFLLRFFSVSSSGSIVNAECGVLSVEFRIPHPKFRIQLGHYILSPGIVNRSPQEILVDNLWHTE